jgi:hypothetical protein
MPFFSKKRRNYDYNLKIQMLRKAKFRPKLAYLHVSSILCCAGEVGPSADAGGRSAEAPVAPPREAVYRGWE